LASIQARAQTLPPAWAAFVAERLHSVFAAAKQGDDSVPIASNAPANLATDRRE